MMRSSHYPDLPPLTPSPCSLPVLRQTVTNHLRVSNPMQSQLVRGKTSVPDRIYMQMKWRRRRRCLIRCQHRNMNYDSLSSRLSGRSSRFRHKDANLRLMSDITKLSISMKGNVSSMSSVCSSSVFNTISLLIMVTPVMICLRLDLLATITVSHHSLNNMNTHPLITSFSSFVLEYSNELIVDWD